MHFSPVISKLVASCRRTYQSVSSSINFQRSNINNRNTVSTKVDLSVTGNHACSSARRLCDVCIKQAFGLLHGLFLQKFYCTPILPVGRYLAYIHPSAPSIPACALNSVCCQIELQFGSSSFRSIILQNTV